MRDIYAIIDIALIVNERIIYMKSYDRFEQNKIGFKENDMKNIMKEFEEAIKDKTFIHGILSNRRTKDRDSYSKIDIKPVLIQGGLNYQLTYAYEKK